MMDNFDIPNDIVFNPKPDAIPYNYRIRESLNKSSAAGQRIFFASHAE